MKRIVVVGSGFAGMWSALSAARLVDLHGASSDIEILVIAPDPVLVVRPRLYERHPGQMYAPLLPLFKACGIRYLRGTVDRVVTGASQVGVVEPSGRHSSVGYDRLVLASGSQLFRPDVPGLGQYGFSIDQLEEAEELEAHLATLASRPHTTARNTVVIVGGGFTGIEIAAEMPARLAEFLGPDVRTRTIVVEMAPEIGPELGAGPRPAIQDALASQGVEYRLGMSVTGLDQDGVTTSTGERIDAQTVVWTAGMRASPLTAQISAQRDVLGRIHVDRNLRVPGEPAVYATGDVAFAATDAHGHHALMSCQHALLLGRTSGHNAAADLLDAPCIPYAQEHYGTTLDLGPWGAVRTDGWDRVVQQTGADAKLVKRFINGQLIYPPAADRTLAFAAAAPISAISTVRDEEPAVV